VLALVIGVIGATACGKKKAAPPGQPSTPPASASPAPTPAPTPKPTPTPAGLTITFAMELTALEGTGNPYAAPLEKRLAERGLRVAPQGADGAVKLACTEARGATYISMGRGGGGTWPRVSCVLDVADGAGKPRLRWELHGPDGPGNLNGDVQELARAAFLDSDEIAALPDLVAVALGDRLQVPPLLARLPALGLRSPVAGLAGLLDATTLDPGGRVALALHDGDVARALREGDPARPRLLEVLALAASDSAMFRRSLQAVAGLAGPDDTAALVALAERVGGDEQLAVQLILALGRLGGPQATEAIAGLERDALPVGARAGLSAHPERVLAAAAARALGAAAPRIPVALTVKLKSLGKRPLVDVEAELRPALLAAGLDAQAAGPPAATLTVTCRESAGPVFEGTSLGSVGALQSRWTRVGCKLAVADAAGKALLALAVQPREPGRIVGSVDQAARAHFLSSSGFALLAEASALVLGRDARAGVVAAHALGFSMEQDARSLAPLLAPHQDQLSPPLRAAWLLASGKPAEAAALGEPALAAFWQLLSSSWGTAESAGAGFGSNAEPIVRRRLPVVQALATIPGAGAGVLALDVLRGLPPAEDRASSIITREGYRLSMGSMVFHPSAAEAALLTVLLPHVGATNPKDARDVVSRFAADAPPPVRAAAEAALSKLAAQP